jgi:hypothetical protein
VCQQVSTSTSGGQVAFRSIRLCETFETHLTGDLSLDDNLAARFFIESSDAFVNALACFEGATHLLIEYDYFDADVRSTASKTVARRFQRHPLLVDRLVFFKVDDSGSPIASCLGLVDAPAPIDSSGSVLGYMVLAPDTNGTVSRSLLPPPSTHPDVKGDFPKHVRCCVPETIRIGGVLKQTRGVPFLQQGGGLLSCAHVAAWSSHYTAVLRGLVPRRHLAEFHDAAARNAAPRRSFPSSGLTADQVAAMMDQLGLPVDSLDFASLAKEARLATWIDRPEVWSDSERLKKAIAPDLPTQPPAKAYEELISRYEQIREELSAPGRSTLTPESDSRPRTRALLHAGPNRWKAVRLKQIEEVYEKHLMIWASETLSRILCQYLNSGFPPILLANDHAVTVVGYLRERDLQGGGESSRIDAVVLLDERTGAFSVRGVREVLEQMQGSYADSRILIPLPLGIWAHSMAVETLGAKIFRLNVINWSNPKVQDDEIDQIGAEVRAGLELLASDLATEDASKLKYSVRTYAMPSGQYKAGFLKRLEHDHDAVRVVRLARLPLYVWVVEIMHRGERDGGDDSVLGEVVFDASDVDIADTSALIVHLPGVIKVHGKDSKWEACSAKRYRSGRYVVEQAWSVDPSPIAERFKHASN